jgi:hypothetical protein
MKERKNVIDCTLRFIYNTFRNYGIDVAIRFKHGGREWEADSPAEAIALRKQLEVRDDQAIENGEQLDWITEAVWTPDRIQELINELGSQQKMFLMLLYDRASVTSYDAKEQMRLASETALAGVVSGLSKQLQRLKLKPEDLYSVTVRWSGKEKTRTFKLSPNFRWVAESEMGWPEGLPPEAKKMSDLLKDHEVAKAVQQAISVNLPGGKRMPPHKSKPGK